jgi:IS30 family transposase
MKKQGKKRLTIEDRMIIQACIHDKRNLTQISARLNVSKSTISREISKFSYTKPGSKYSCAQRNRLGLCNGCKYTGACPKEKRFYNFKIAEGKSSNLRSSPRSKSKLPIESVKTIDAIVADGVRLGQSLHHIFISNPSLLLICCERTIRRLVYRGNLSIRPHELRRYVTYKHSYKKSPKELRLRDIRVLIGRTYKDFTRKILSNKRANIVQYDSIIGCISDKKAILTITFQNTIFNLVFSLTKDLQTSLGQKLENYLLN